MYIKKTSIIIISILFGTGCATPLKRQYSKPVEELRCSDIGNISSTEGKSKYQIEFVNSLDQTVNMFWINYEGEEELKQTMLPGDSWGVDTYVTHPWVVRNNSGKCIAFYNSKSRVFIEIK